MAARTRKTRCDDLTRERIQTTQLVKRLQGHALGEVEMTQTQLRAAEILLRKTLPDLSQTDVTIDDHREIAAYTDAELTAMLRTRAASVSIDETPRPEGEALN
jgi:hypothetical protein